MLNSPNVFSCLALIRVVSEVVSGFLIYSPLISLVTYGSPYIKFAKHYHHNNVSITFDKIPHFVSRQEMSSLKWYFLLSLDDGKRVLEFKTLSYR